MEVRPSLQAIVVAGKIIKRDDQEVVVDTDRITPQQRKWDGVLIQIRPLRNGKSQIVRIR